MRGLPLVVLPLVFLLAACSGPEPKYDFDNDGVDDADDCAPEDASIYPGAQDPYGDGIDQDCDGVDGLDADGDGYAVQGDDCDDLNAEINPDATEICGNGDDEDCDGLTDDADPDCQGDDDDAVDDDDDSGQPDDDDVLDDDDSSLSDDDDVVDDDDDVVDDDDMLDDDDSSTDDDDSSTDDDDIGPDDDDSAAVDADGDGVAADLDCDDSDPGVFPLAGDTHGDGVDSDCDGIDCEAAWTADTYFTACPDSALWSEAASLCIGAGYDALATVLDAGDQVFLEALRPDATLGYWIGFNDIDVEGTYAWHSGMPVTYTNWYTATEPSGQASTDEDCVHFANNAGGVPDGEWNDNWCSSMTHAYFCELRDSLATGDDDDSATGDDDDSAATVDDDGDGVAAELDCDDSDPESTTLASDADCDGVVDDLLVQGMTFFPVSGGAFDMGCANGQSSCSGDETPVTTVTLTNDFWLSETEVTQGQWEALMLTNPSDFGPNGGGPVCGTTCPVERVDWYEALEFANAVSAAEFLPDCYTLTTATYDDFDGRAPAPEFDRITPRSRPRAGP